MSRTLRTTATVGAALSGLLAAGTPSVASAAGQSSCITCHLDEGMLARNLGVVKARKSSLQSGAG
jgi:hypothetical protein